MVTVSSLVEFGSTVICSPWYSPAAEVIVGVAVVPSGLATKAVANVIASPACAAGNLPACPISCSINSVALRTLACTCVRFITVPSDRVVLIIPAITVPATITRMATATSSSSSEKPFCLFPLFIFRLQQAFTIPPQKGLAFSDVTVDLDRQDGHRNKQLEQRETLLPLSTFHLSITASLHNSSSERAGLQRRYRRSRQRTHPVYSGPRHR